MLPCFSIFLTLGYEADMAKFGQKPTFATAVWIEVLSRDGEDHLIEEKYPTDWLKKVPAVVFGSLTKGRYGSFCILAMDLLLAVLRVMCPRSNFRQVFTCQTRSSGSNWMKP